MAVDPSGIVRALLAGENSINVLIAAATVVIISILVLRSQSRLIVHMFRNVNILSKSVMYMLFTVSTLYFAQKMGVIEYVVSVISAYAALRAVGYQISTQKEEIERNTENSL